MTIVFVCPNGHQLTAPQELAGKPGKCPKCATKFLIPTLEEAGLLDEDSAAEFPAVESQPTGDSRKPVMPPAPASPTGSSPGAKPANGSGKWKEPAAEPAKGSNVGASKSKPGETIVFLCPNGHKLNGPASLKGKAGKCPHCGAKFFIPTDEELAASDSEPVPTGDVVDAAVAPPPVQPPPTPPARPQPAADDEEVPIVEVVSSWQFPPPQPSGGHRLAELFTWIWGQRPPRCAVEIYLKDGQTFSPKMFSPELSQRDYGVFLVPDDLGKFTMTTLAWDHVAKVVVRNLDDIPAALFE